MKSVYIDESGYTGIDLLNQGQPYQGASAIYISDSEAREIICTYFPNLKAKELKYRNLARKSSNWERLLGLQKDLLKNHVCVSYVCDKKYLLILHFLDYAVEPFYYDNGINFYKDGHNYSLASLLYFTGNTLLGGNNFEEILSHFQYAMKSKSELSISALIEKIKASPWNEMPEVLEPLVLENTSCIETMKNKDITTDIADIVLQSLISRLEVEIDHNYEIVHDKSKNLEQYDVILNKMIKHENEISFKATELTRLKFPLNLRSISQVDSIESSGVQLADVLVGGIMDSAKAINGVKVNDYNIGIAKLYKDNQLIHLSPCLDFEQQIEFRQGNQGSEVIDYFSKFFG